MKPTLLVLAAGMGSRYGGLKQMDPMGPNGETVLDYSVYDAIRAGFGRVVFIIRHDFADEFKAQVGDKFADKIEVDYAYQDLNDLPEGFSLPEGRTKPWGTTHAIWAARDIMPTPFAVINADDFYGSDSFKQITSYFDATAKSTDGVDHYCMVGYKLQNTLSEHGSVNRGICSDENGFLKDVEEHTEIQVEEDGVCRGENLAGDRVEVSVDSIASMNFWGFPPSIMKDLEEHFIAFLKERGTEMKSECYIPTVVDEMLKSGKADCNILETSSSWFGVTYPEDKEMCVNSIRTLIDQGEYPANLWG
ncbi:MobA-like NTP transferase domain-containing protein [Rubritalea squalenifaciens DSM 18772]|uniref:MobA-like NTP transferase domain-containing protein n=1 Tax=Rubritalea squalenifaciens DSM 18772 TaxID=1123071 RepID=A0A1M6EVL1_9BACT|nr:sugar phosphate nucleotidyltransferase [Rubritalea squalenifaciens]SHI89446.1 MobA-like NTP transferase domain-containing protein [Rubritalea squalenifaciens DSM 18772]